MIAATNHGLAAEGCLQWASERDVDSVAAEEGVIEAAEQHIDAGALVNDAANDARRDAGALDSEHGLRERSDHRRGQHRRLQAAACEVGGLQRERQTGHVADLNDNPSRPGRYERRNPVDYLSWRIYDFARQLQVAGNVIWNWHVHDAMRR